VERAAMTADDGKTMLAGERAWLVGWWARLVGEWEARRPRGASGQADRPATPGWVVPALIVVFALGMAVGGPLTFVETDRLAGPAEAVLRYAPPVFLTAAVFIVGGVLAALWFRYRWLPGVVGRLDSIVSAALAADAARREQGYEAARPHAERAALEAVAWYSVGALRRWTLRAALALFVALGGVLGAALLLRQIALLRDQNVKIDRQVELLGDQNTKIEAQTALLREQNEKLDQQTVTVEAARRGARSTELFALLQKASELPPDDEARRRAFVGRVVAFTSAATPFFYVKVEAGRASSPEGEGTGAGGPLRGRAKPELIERPLSPERGQLLVGLLAAGADLAPLIEARATFAWADLRGADLPGAVLSRADLRGADLSDAGLAGANLSGANLSHADLSRASLLADLSGAFLSFADLSRAYLSGAFLHRAVLAFANLSGADLSRANLAFADLSRADLRGADLSGAFLFRANLSFADLSHADLSGALLSGANLSGAMFDGAIVSVGSLEPGRLPAGFPTGWEGPPPGWELVREDGDLVRLRRSGTPPPAPPAPSR
jgi:uncharacterized protein YjbI with pentapeptide repeats